MTSSGDTSATDLQSAFKEVMAGVATPVAIVTSVGDGEPYGTTVSSFCSLSLDPPMVSVCLDRRSDLLPVVTASRVFGLNILSHQQAALASVFARKGGPSKFDGIPHEMRGGVPCFPDVLGHLVCEVAELVPGGDHVVAFGLVLDAAGRAGEPLTYHRRAFGTHAALRLTA